MPYGKLHVLPLSLFILIPVTFLITYTISVQWDHVVPGFPYISETGSLSPESCIFAQLLNIATLLLACCVYIRHRQVAQWQTERGSDLVSKKMVLVTAWCGALACFGLNILANFQETRVVVAHMIGAMTCFTAGTVYFCLQVMQTVKQPPNAIVIYDDGFVNKLSLSLPCVRQGQRYRATRRLDAPLVPPTFFINFEYPGYSKLFKKVGGISVTFSFLVLHMTKTYLSQKMVPAVNGPMIVYVRVCLSTLTLILTAATIVPGYMSMMEFQGNDYKKWLPTDGGWGWHVASAVSEWVLVIVYCAFLVTFVPEFRLINFEDPVVTLIYLDKDPNLKILHKLDSQNQES